MPDGVRRGVCKEPQPADLFRGEAVHLAGLPARLVTEADVQDALTGSRQSFPPGYGMALSPWADGHVDGRDRPDALGVEVGIRAPQLEVIFVPRGVRDQRRLARRGDSLPEFAQAGRVVFQQV